MLNESLQFSFIVLMENKIKIDWKEVKIKYCIGHIH